MPGPSPRWRLASAAILLAAGPAAGQDGLGLSFGSTAPEAGAGAQEAARQPGSLLVIDRERVLAESERGRALLAELDADGQALADENREIEARLRAEERALTERRPEMEPEAFRAEADAFDARVQEIRAAQADKGRELIARREAQQRRFWDEAVPVLAEILRERGAVVVLERDGVFLSSDSADITAQAIARIDAAEGGGSSGSGEGSVSRGDLDARPDEAEAPARPEPGGMLDAPPAEPAEDGAPVPLPSRD